MKTTKPWVSLFVGMFLISACATPQRGGPDLERGLIGMFKGLGHLVLSPFQIAAGLAEGALGSLPAAVVWPGDPNTEELGCWKIEGGCC